MEFRIADTFTDSLARLTGDEQKVVKTTAFDLQIDPSGGGLQFHRLERPRDRRFWSVRASRDIRLIVHRTENSLLLCYVGHHDDAYQWAERRKLETHPTTGSAQMVEIRERVEEIVVPRYVEVEQPAPPKPPLFAGLARETLLRFGVPVEWLEDVLRATEDTLLDLADHLPAEAAEALLTLATGGTPGLPEPASAPSRGGGLFKRSEESEWTRFSRALGGTPPPVFNHPDPFEHPDALRRFRTIGNVEELARALEYPWEKWAVFLHPTQLEAVERTYSGPARVSGSAGTGKTIVALHRAVFLARRQPEARVLLTTFSEALANALRAKLRVLIASEPRLGERIEVHALNAIARRLYELNVGRPELASRDLIQRELADAARAVEGLRFSLRFLLSEWEDVVDAWQLESWEAYRDVARLGRKTRLPERQRALLWSVFERVRSWLASRGLVTWSGVFSRLASEYQGGRPPPFDFVVVDEAQDVSVQQLRFLAALGTGRRNTPGVRLSESEWTRSVRVLGDGGGIGAGRADALFFAGDLGQRIFQQPFSWKSLGVDVRGRSRTLRINYRTSHQIRTQADRLLGPEVTDVDGISESRRGTTSVFNGPEPDVHVLDTVRGEAEMVARWLTERVAEGVQPHEIGVFVRSEDELERARVAVGEAGLPFQVLDERIEPGSGRVSISTMHLAKGLEFRAVAVMACDDEVIPLQARIESVADDADLDEVYATERHLLYVACTRARDHLLVTSVDPASEFFDDFMG